MNPDQANINRWSGAAPFWEKYRETIRQMFVPVTQALVEDSGIDRGHAVLDIATGPGEPALDVAALVGPEGRVVGVDPIPEMVAAARRASDRLAFKNTQFDVALAVLLAVQAADTFDAVISRFEVMLFPSPRDAVREMLRVLKPGKKLALAVWDPRRRESLLRRSRVTRTLYRFAASARRRAGRFPFCESRQVTKHTGRRGRDGSLRAPLPIRHTGAAFSAKDSGLAMRDVRKVTRSGRLAFGSNWRTSKLGIARSSPHTP